jgi:hypothetical protein
MNTWTQRAVFYFRDEVGKPRKQVKEEKEAKQTALLRAFLRGPDSEEEWSRVEWEKASRREESVKNERGQKHGVAVVYEAPLEEP